MVAIVVAIVAALPLVLVGVGPVIVIAVAVSIRPDVVRTTTVVLRGARDRGGRGGHPVRGMDLLGLTEPGWVGLAHSSGLQTKKKKKRIACSEFVAEYQAVYKFTIGPQPPLSLPNLLSRLRQETKIYQAVATDCISRIVLGLNTWKIPQQLQHSC